MSVLIPENARNLLSQPLIVRITSIDFDGYPHTIPVWFIMDGDQLLITTDRNTRKVDYWKANPKGSIQIGGDVGQDGYLFKGDFAIEEDPDFKWLKKITYAYETKEEAEKSLAEWTQWDMVILRFTPKKVIKVF